MTRATSGAARHRKKVRVRKAVKGYRGGRSKLYRTSLDAITRAGVYAFRDRRARKGDFRGLWVVRLNAACRDRGINYSRFIFGLKASSVIINRKMLSEIALADPAAFDALVKLAKMHQPAAAA